MINLLMALTAMTGVQAANPAPATAPAPAAAPSAVRPLASVPGITVNYFDIAGTNIADIQKSLQAIQAANTHPTTKWDVRANIKKRTEGTACTIESANVGMTAVANLPRLAAEAQVPAPVLANWKTYVAEIEATAAKSLWFVADRLPSVQASLAGKSCDQAQSTMDAALNKLKADQKAYADQQIAALKAAADARAAEMKKKNRESADDRRRAN